MRFFVHFVDLKYNSITKDYDRVRTRRQGLVGCLFDTTTSGAKELNQAQEVCG